MIAVDTDRERCAEVFALRCVCWQNGYRPLAVYSPGAKFRGELVKGAGKRPVTTDWLKLAMQDPPWVVGDSRRVSSLALNTGLLTGEMSGLDIGAMTKDVVDQIVSRIEEVLGPTPLSRTGNPPQILMCYRAAEPFGKISTQHYTMPDGSKAHFEILGAGQQVVAFGVHPVTWQPYRWADRSPADTPLAELPEITAEQAHDLINEVAAIIEAADGVSDKPENPVAPPPDRRNSNGNTFNVNNAALDNIAAGAPALQQQGEAGAAMSEPVFPLTFFPDRFAKTKIEANLSYGQFVELMQTGMTPQHLGNGVYFRPDCKAKLSLLSLHRYRDVPSENGALRCNANVLTSFGCVGDYDGEQLGLEEAVEKLNRAQIAAVVYSSPSYSPEKPRWRVCCWYSEPQLPSIYPAMISRVNGALGGVLAGESWTLSQGYFYGQVKDGHPVLVLQSEGQPIDQRDELDLTAIGRPARVGPVPPEAEDAPHTPGALQTDIANIRAALACIPNDWVDWNEYKRLALAVFASCGGSDEGKALFIEWSAQSLAYDAAETEAVWEQVLRSPPDRIGFGSLVYWARLSDPEFTPKPRPGGGLEGPEDFYAYLPAHKFIFVPTRELWPADSINARFPMVQVGIDENGKAIKVKPSVYLVQTRAVQQMTWLPSPPNEPPVIRDLLVNEGGWFSRPGATVFNLYMPPVRRAGGDRNNVKPWLDHIRKIYPDDIDHIVLFLAHRVQQPWDKINHALVLSGPPGIGKDWLLEAVVQAVGPWNVKDTRPEEVMGKYNGFAQAVIMRVNEVHDLGEVDRFSFYERMKWYCAAPPETIQVNDKYVPIHPVFNVVSVIETSNHKTDGMYLPANDRRHYVAWSNLTEADFPEPYWDEHWGWYHSENGLAHVAAYLASLDISSFKPKAPPKRTAAFWDIVSAHSTPENAELMDILDRLGNPDVITLDRVIRYANGGDKDTEPPKPGIDFNRSDFVNNNFANWLSDRRNRGKIPHRFQDCGYAPVRNDDAKEGLWKMGARRQVVYGKVTIPRGELVRQVGELIVKSRNV